MKIKLFFCYFAVLIFFSGKLLSQTYQLTGNPVNTTGWDVVPSAIVNGDFIQLTTDQTSQIGGIKLNDPINLKSCDNWRVEFDFRIDGNGTYARGDGIAFWYLANPPVTYVSGNGLGIPDNAEGLMVALDIYNNSNDSEMSKVHVLYGTNTGNIEFNNTAGSTFHSQDFRYTMPFFGPNYRHVEVEANVDPANPANWIIRIEIDNNLIVNQSFAPSGGALNMNHGYFGFSASTGAATARHSIKNVKVYADKLTLLQTSLAPEVCINQTTGTGSIDLTAYNAQLINNPNNYIFTYIANGTPIANPSHFQYTGNTTVLVFVKDPSSTLCDGNAIIELNPIPFATTDASLTGCSNNNSGTATFDLTSATVTSFPGVTKEFYNTMHDLNTGTNQITNPTAYPSGAATIFVKVTTPQGCVSTSAITLNLHPTVTVTDVPLRSCFHETNPSLGTFNLSTANVTTATGTTKKYYPSLTDAIDGTNEILNFLTYTAPSGVIYVKVFNAQGCYSVAKVTLTVIAPVKSNILEDKIICIEDTTTLDAGPGFSSYEWSTGATTSSIPNVGVGTYWVRLGTGDCITLQNVKVYASEQPVITSIDISGGTVTVFVKGGTPPYQYSMDNINWQESNVFTNVTRGETKIFVKDSYDCEPISINITVPNLINVITPNGDGINDAIDYSALSNKQNLVIGIFDRYGYKLFQADQSNRYRWDGTNSGGRKVSTGNYWYSITWNENDKNSTPIQFSGWIMVKNRE